MRAATISLVLAFALSKVLAQETTQSAPFNLVLFSSNTTINGSVLDSCHEGAAIEGLCLGGSTASSYDQYTFNFSSQATPDPALGVVGSLTWELEGGNFNLSSPMSLSINPTSNVAVPLFTPSDSYTQVGFDADNKLFIPQYLDDTVYPATYAPKPLYRWYACITDDTYTYQTLAWVIGSGEPENPTCQKVDVKRVFV